MEKRILIITLAVIAITSAAYVSHKSVAVQEYALLEIGHFGLGTNVLTAVYEDGTQENLEKILNVKMKGDWNSQENFPNEVKAFKYLNDKGYTLISHACNSQNNNAYYSYVFVRKRE